MKRVFAFFLMVFFFSCKKKNDSNPLPPGILNFNFVKIDDKLATGKLVDISLSPEIKINFTEAIDRQTISNSVFLKENGSTTIPVDITYESGDSTLILRTQNPLSYLTHYFITITTDLESVKKSKLSANINSGFLTILDSSDKFPLISDDELLDKVERETFKYFWDFGHPVSGLSRERNSSGDVVTSGGSGFGIMTIVTAVHRGFITRAEGLARLQTIVSFLKNTAQHFHGAFSHWLNGASGVVIPFSTKDDGADLVETAYLMQGLLTARQYFNSADPAETSLRDDINNLWNAVEWNWFRKNDENVLYWHWSPNYNWDMNVQIRGWNEALITYVLAAASPNYSIPKIVYDNGWAANGSIINNNSYYGIQLPLGPAYGGPLFFSHYSFLGINPKDLTDSYANYWTQNTAHTLINYNYCITNPKNYFGYSDECWGLTASDDNISGYLAHAPNNDDGVISPMAALSSFPYTPQESLKALKFFYYKLGDKLWKTYGFSDAFSLNDAWFANSFLAIDQGPIIIMIENYRSSLLWNLFMSCPEVKTGMQKLGFQSPHF